jgi:elongator complex protein 4
MSSFKRKSVAKTAPVYPGTRFSPASSTTVITSTGIPSLDDILGGGLPLSTSCLIAAPDPHSSYGDLVQKYFISQGLILKHRVITLHDDGEQFSRELMWTPKAPTLRSGVTPSTVNKDGDPDKGEDEGQEESKIKIAWRYEQMKQFQTTIGASSSYATLTCNTLKPAHTSHLA